MNTQSKVPEYLLLFRGTDWSKNLSPEETQRVVGQFRAWFERLIEQGKVISGKPLEREGRIVSGKHGRLVSDGPFAETKEAIGGFFLLRVNDLEEAVAIAKQCPVLEYGGQVEVRPVAEQCPVTGEALPDTELAHAAA